MTNRYEPNVESLDDRTLLAGGLWSTLGSLHNLFGQRGNSHAGEAAEISDASTVENSTPTSSGVWSLLDDFLDGALGGGSDHTSSQSPSASADQGANFWDDWPHSFSDLGSQGALGGGSAEPLGQGTDGGNFSTIVQTVQGIIGEIADFLGNMMQSNSNWGGYIQGQGAEPTSAPGSPAVGSGIGTGVQWPFGSNGWPTWLPSFIQQNLSVTDGEVPPGGGPDGGSSGEPSAPTTSPPDHAGDPPSSGGSTHGGVGGGAAGGGEQPADSTPGNGDGPDEGTPIIAEGGERPTKPGGNKIVIPPSRTPSEVASSAQTGDAEAVNASESSADTPPRLVAEGKVDESRMIGTDSTAKSEDQRLGPRGAEDLLVETGETLEGADASETQPETLVAECTMWLADLVSALGTSEGWGVEAGDLFDRLPGSYEIEDSREALAVSPLALFGTASFAGGALYWQRYGRRRSALIGANAVDEFFMNLSMDP